MATEHTPLLNALPLGGIGQSDEQQRKLQAVEQRSKAVWACVSLLVWMGWLAYTCTLMYDIKDTQLCGIATTAGTWACVYLACAIVDEILVLVGAVGGTDTTGTRASLGCVRFAWYVYGWWCVHPTDTPECALALVKSGYVLWWTCLVVGIVLPCVMALVFMLFASCMLSLLATGAFVAGMSNTTQEATQQSKPTTRPSVVIQQQPLIRNETVKWSEGMESRCGVCQESFEAGQDVVCLSCDDTHVFHEACMLVTQTRSKGQVCPICKTNVKESPTNSVEP